MPARVFRRLLAGIVLISATGWVSGNARAETLATAPAWTLKDTNGRTVRLADFCGKVVLLNFWATWCPPCRLEIPGFIALQEKYGSKGFVVVGVAMDEERDDVAAFVRRHGINYPVVYGDASVAISYGGVSVVPTTFLLGKDGRIVFMAETALESGKLEAIIEPLL